MGLMFAWAGYGVFNRLVMMRERCVLPMTVPSLSNATWTRMVVRLGTAPGRNFGTGSILVPEPDRKKGGFSWMNPIGNREHSGA